MDRILKTVTDYPSVRIYSIPGGKSHLVCVGNA